MMSGVRSTLHRRLLAACAMAVLLATASATAWAQAETPLPRPVPKLIERSAWAATPLWREHVDADPGFVIGEVTVLRRYADGLTLLVRERPSGSDPVVEQRVRIERRGAAGQVLWRQPVPGLPARFDAFCIAFAPGVGDAPSLLVTTFLPGENRKGAPYGRIIEVDERAGQLHARGGVPRPSGPWSDPDNDAIELHGVLRLPGERIAIYGGFSTGPWHWWIATQRLDGTSQWQVVDENTAGEVTDLRATPDGYEASAYMIMSYGSLAGGDYRLRFDNSGSLISSVKMTDNGVWLFAADGSAAAVGTADPPTLIVEDRQGRRRVLAELPKAAQLRGRLDDGSWVFSDEPDHVLVLSADSRSAFHIERDIRYDSILPDGSIFTAHCRDPDSCTTRELALYRRPW